MTVTVSTLPAEDPYEGLRELTAKVWALVLKRLERIQAWRKILPIRGGAPGVFEDIRNFLWNLLSFLSPWNLFDWLRWKVFDPLQNFLRHHILNPFLNWIAGLQDRLIGWWAGAINSLKSHLTWISDRVTGWWHGAINWILGHLTHLKDSMIGWWRGAINGLKSHLTWISDRVTGWWHGAINWILGHLTMLKDRILGWWAGAIDRIYAVIERLRVFLHDPLEGLRQIWRRFQESWAGQLLSSLISGFSSLWNMVINGLRELWSRLQPTLIAAAERAITFAKPYISRWVEGFEKYPATFLNWATAQAGTDLALHPSTALATAGGLYAMSIAAGTAAMLVSTAVNLLPGMNWVGASQFAGFIAEAAAFEPLTRATYGVLLNDALAWPLRYHWNMQLRPKLPTEGTIFLMGRKRGIDRSQFYQAMGYQGIPNWWLDKIYLFFWTDPSPFWLARIAESTIPDWKPGPEWQEWADRWIPGWRSDPFKWLRAKLMLAGYESADVDSMIQGIQGKLMASAITQVKTGVRAMLREAYWTKADAAGALRPLQVREEEIELLYVAEELDYQKGYLDDQVRLYKEAFRKGEIHLQDLTLALSTIIVKPERVAQEVSRERVRALKKPKSIVAPKEDPLVTRLRRMAIDSWIRLYREWKIDEEDLLLGLIIVVEDPDLAAEMVAVELTRVRPEPPDPLPPPKDPLIAKSERQAIASWIKAFRDEEIDKDQLDLGLAPLIPDVDTLAQVVALEELRFRPTPDLIPPVKEDPIIAKIRAARVRAHIEMFQKRLIVIEQLYAYLLGDGLVEPVVRATVISQASKRVRIPRLDSPYFLKDVIRDLVDQGLVAYEQMFMEEKITIDQYVAWLTSITADPDVVTYLADTLTLRRFLEGL